jgi:hypothetical protein
MCKKQLYSKPRSLTSGSSAPLFHAKTTHNEFTESRSRTANSALNSLSFER